MFFKVKKTVWFDEESPYEKVRRVPSSRAYEDEGLSPEAYAYREAVLRRVREECLTRAVRV